MAVEDDGDPYKWEGVTGKHKLMSSVSGHYIHEVTVGNRNIIILA